MSKVRVERDSLGEIEVPAECYYGAQTERARLNFQISGLTMPVSFLHAMALIKAEAAKVHAEMGALPEEIAAAIVQAADEIVAGRFDDQFPVDVFQTGSGTSSNMNVNEVIANRAIELLGGERGSKAPVHPNDHVNLGQSSNDTVPTAIHIAAYVAVVDRLRPALDLLAESLQSKTDQFASVVKIGRTHLQDAVPLRLGQEFSGYTQQVRNSLARVDSVLPRLAELALGGTAVGTGLNAPPGFADRVIASLAARTGHPFVPAPNRFEALAARDSAAELSGALRTVAGSLRKIANDLRWLGSGPRCGLGEIRLPALQPGSSIMPGKVNPVVPESVIMITAQVIGNDATVALAGMGGDLELNVMMPVLVYNLLQSIELLSNGARMLAVDCVDGLEVDLERAEAMVERSLAMVTSLAPRIGYDRAAAIAQEAYSSGRTVREVAFEQEVLPADELDRLLDPRTLT